MQLAFKNQATGQYIKSLWNIATHWHQITYTDDINDAWLYPEEYFNRRTYSDQEPYLQDEIRRWKERKGEVIVPVVTSIKSEGEYNWTPAL